MVHAKPADLDTVEQLLKVLDQRSGPENVEAEAQPRPIPVYNTTAAEVAQIVQQVYQDRMAGGGGGVMSPQDMMKMIRGGGNNSEQQVQKMSIAVDTRNNILIVRAPDALFKEVKALVNESGPVARRFAADDEGRLAAAHELGRGAEGAHFDAGQREDQHDARSDHDRLAARSNGLVSAAATTIRPKSRCGGPCGAIGK